MMNAVINLDELLAILAMAAILGNALAVGAAVLLTRRFADLEAAVDRLGHADALPAAQVSRGLPWCWRSGCWCCWCCCRWRRRGCRASPCPSWRTTSRMVRMPSGCGCWWPCWRGRTGCASSACWACWSTARWPVRPGINSKRKGGRGG